MPSEIPPINMILQEQKLIQGHNEQNFPSAPAAVAAIPNWRPCCFSHQFDIIPISSPQLTHVKAPFFLSLLLDMTGRSSNALHTVGQRPTEATGENNAQSPFWTLLFLISLMAPMAAGATVETQFSDGSTSLQPYLLRNWQWNCRIPHHSVRC